jgi:hypothetical protein
MEAGADWKIENAIQNCGLLSWQLKLDIKISKKSDGCLLVSYQWEQAALFTLRFRAPR